MKKVSVVGLGYVGLPVAVLAASKGYQVFGLDVSQEKVDLINAGQSPLVDNKLAASLSQYPIEASTDPSIVKESEIIIIAVPTPVSANNLPNLEPLKQALASLKPHLTSGQLLIIESTINPGIMDEVVKPQVSGTGVQLIHCPERINPGDSTWTVENIPRVLGAYASEAAEQARAFYQSILTAPVTIMNSVTEAEAVKILENTFRDVNIAFVNEMAQSFDKLGIDITNVIAGASTKPFGFLAHYPGNGVGGHCISVDPYYMIERAKQVGFDHKFLQLARNINNYMPLYTVQRLLQAEDNLGLKPQDVSVAVLGVSYKKDIDDSRESPAFDIISDLKQKNIPHCVFDPFLPEHSTVTSLSQALSQSQAIILSTDHTQIITELTPSSLQKHGIQILIDGKNSIDPSPVLAAGVKYLGIGR